MTVADVQKLIIDLSSWVAERGGKQISSDLSRFIEGLEAHREKTINEFSTWLIQSAAPDSSGDPTVKTGKPKRTPDPKSVERAVKSLRAMLDSVESPSLAFEQITDEINRLDRELTKEEGLKVAREFGISESFKSKTDALQAIGRKIIDRKTFHERAMGISKPSVDAQNPIPDERLDDPS
jgi:hypothetical protein